MTKYIIGEIFSSGGRGATLIKLWQSKNFGTETLKKAECIFIFLGTFFLFQIVKHGGNGQQSPSSDDDIKNTKTTNPNNTPAGDTTDALEVCPLKV